MNSNKFCIFGRLVKNGERGFLRTRRALRSRCKISWSEVYTSNISPVLFALIFKTFVLPLVTLGSV
jgi:hypothetical protein